MKTLIVYAHLLAACVAIGILLIQDLALAKTRGKALSAAAIKDLTKSADIMFIALIVLWIGIGTAWLFGQSGAVFNE